MEENKRTLADYRRPAVTVDKLDLLADTIFSATKSPSTITMIFTVLKLAIALAYISVRAKLIKEEIEVESQRSRNDNIRDNRDETDDGIDY